MFFFLLTYDCMLPTIALTCKTWCLVVDVHFFAIIIYQTKLLLSDNWQISGCGRQGWLFKGVKCESKWCHDFIHRQQIRRGNLQINTVKKFHTNIIKYPSNTKQADVYQGGLFSSINVFTKRKNNLRQSRQDLSNFLPLAIDSLLLVKRNT